jgi:predicted DNA-binding transcriptional regulator
MLARSADVVAAALSLGLLVFMSSPAMAGDPCPIGLAVVDLGLPDWADPALRERVKDGDPLLARMVRLAGELECNEVSVAPPKDGKITVQLHEKVDAAKMAVAHVKGKLVDKERRFRCSDAARELKYLKPTGEQSGMILYYRGHSRILLVSPGWKSMCVSAVEADRMTDKQVVDLWNKVTGPLVKDRHDNP